MKSKGGVSLETLDQRLQRIEEALDPSSELPTELVITPSEIQNASQAKLESLVRQLHVKIPAHMLREAIQRHLVKYGTLVEKPPIEDVSEPPVKEKPPTPPKATWTPKKGMSVKLKGHRKTGRLGRTKRGDYLVKFKDGSKAHVPAKELFKKVIPVKARK